MNLIKVYSEILFSFLESVIEFLQEYWIGVLTVIALVVLFFVISEEQKQWMEFASSHDCKIVSKERDQIIPTTSIDAKGNVISSTTIIYGKTGYFCNDGITYYR